MRRLVTGHTPEGKATFAGDNDVEERIVPFPSGSEMFRVFEIWGTDGAPTLPQLPPHGPQLSYPGVGGIRFGILTFPPNTDVGGMHITDTIDMYYVLSGEVCLELDGRNERVVRAGDTLVQNGTIHAWHNRKSEPCRMVSFMVGAKRS